MNGFKLHAAASVVFAAGVPGYVWQSGEFTGIITDVGVGNVTLLFQADKGVDAAESVIICTPRAAQVASGLTSIGVTHTDDVRKPVTIVQEGGAGAASVRADVDFDVLVFVRT